MLERDTVCCLIAIEAHRHRHRQYEQMAADALRLSRNPDDLAEVAEVRRQLDLISEPL